MAACFDLEHFGWLPFRMPDTENFQNCHFLQGSFDTNYHRFIFWLFSSTVHTAIGYHKLVYSSMLRNKKNSILFQRHRNFPPAKEVCHCLEQKTFHLKQEQKLFHGSAGRMIGAVMSTPWGCFLSSPYLFLRVWYAHCWLRHLGEQHPS